MIAFAAGIALYYLQVYAYYDEVEVDKVQLTSLISGEAEEILFENFKAIDSNSSPVRYRACYETPSSLAMLTETFVIYDEAEPLVAPSWFDCFDADALGADLEVGTSTPMVARLRGTRLTPVARSSLMATQHPSAVHPHPERAND